MAWVKSVRKALDNLERHPKFSTRSRELEKWDLGRGEKQYMTNIDLNFGVEDKVWGELNGLKSLLPAGFSPSRAHNDVLCSWLMLSANMVKLSGQFYPLIPMV